MNQHSKIERVRGAIGSAVLAFCRQRGAWKSFHAAELNAFVQQHSGRAPASADRILRLLRAEGVIDYVVEDRRASLYVLTAVK